MFGRSQHTTTNSRKIIFIALTIGLGFWLFETVLHEYLFDKQSFANMVLPGNVHEIWMRSFITFVIIGFGIYAQFIANRLNENRQRYQSLFENAPDAIALADIETGRVIDVNPAACRLLRRQKAEVVGLHQSELHPPTMAEDSKRLFDDHLRQIGRGGNAPPVEHLILSSDGKHVPVEIAAQIVTIQGRAVLQGIFRDITERKKAEQELRASEERLSEAQRVAQIGNWSWNLKTNQLYWSEENYRIFGLSDDVVPSYEAFIDTLHPEDVEFVNTSVSNTLEKRAPYKIDYRIILSDGSERIIYTTGKVDYDEEGKPARFYGTIQDITERRQHEENLRRSEEKFRLLFEHAGDYILVLEIPPNGVPIIRDANSSALQMHGYTREELIGQLINLLDIESVDPAVAEERVKRLLNNETLNFEARHRRKDGSVFDVEISTRAMRASPSLLVVSIERDITERKKAAEAMKRQAKLLDSIRHAQSLFIAAEDPKPVFDSLLEALVNITDSEYGFLDEVRRDENGTIYKKSLAISNISWDEESRRLYEQLETSNMEFRNMTNLAGAPAATGNLLISNNPAGHPHSGGLPKGHPPLNSYMGIPVFFGGQLVGVAGVANRPGGYDGQMAAFLETFIATCGAIIHAVRNQRKEQQITSALKESEERYRRIVEDQTEFLVRWRPDGTRTFVNDCYCRYFGITQETAVGTSFFPLITDNSLETVKRRIKTVSPEMPVSTRELQVIRPDGTSGWTQWTDRAIFNDAGELLEFQSVGRDITERKLAEDALRESEKRNFALFDDAAVAVWEEDFSQVKEYFDKLRSSGISDLREYFARHPDDVVRCADMVRIINVNKESVKMLKAPSKEELLVHLPDYFDTEQAWEVFREELVALSEGQTHFYREARIRCQNGEELIVDLRLSVLSGYEATLERVYVSFIDITEQKRAETALRASEDKFKGIAEQSITGICIIQDGRFVYVNPRIAEMLDFKPEEMVGQRVLDLVAEPDRALVTENMRRRLSGEVSFVHYTFEALKKNGSGVLMEVHGSIMNYQGRPAIVATLLDITERKHAEYRLIKSEENYRNLYEGAPLGYQSLDSSGNFIDVNKEWLRTLGYSKEEVIGKCFSEFLAPECELSFAQKFPKFKAAGKMRGNEFEMIKKDGSRIITSFAGNIEYDTEGNFRRTHCIMHDITERKRAEEQVRQEALMRETLLNNLPCIGLILKKGTREIVACNEAARKAGAEIGKTCFETCAHRDSSCPFCLAPKVWEDGKPRRLEVESMGRYYEGVWVPLTNELYAHYIFDISDRKQAEQARADSEKKYRAVVENAGEGIVVAQDGTLRFVNPRFAAITGYSQEELMCRPFTDYIHKDDRDRIIDIHNRRLAGESIPAAQELKILDKQGNTRWLENNGILIEWNGRPASLNFLRDVTDRKKAEEAILESEERFRGIFENSLVGLYRTTPEGRILMANLALVKMLRYDSAEKLMERDLEKDGFETPHDRSDFKRLIEEQERLVGFESAWIRADGTTLYVRESTRVVRDDHGNILYYEGTVEDITDRKKAEREREDAARFPSENPYPVLRISADGIVTHANPASLKLLDDLNSGVGQRAPDIWLPCVREARSSRKIQRIEVEHDGRIFALRAVPIAGVTYVNLYGTDVTEQNEVQKELLDRQERLKSLASELSLTEERERRRLATDLHDQIGQSLVLSKIKLDLLRRSAASGELTGAIEEVCNYLAQVIADTRTLTFDLSSPILYELGLEAAIAEWLNDEIKIKHGIATEFYDDRQVKPIDDDIRTILFRNVRELLINVVKHANAGTVKVSIIRAGEQVNVCVEDDGVGFDPEEIRARAAKKANFGLFSIRERLEQLGGQIGIVSSPGNGCKITMTAPLKKTDFAAEPYSI